MKEFKQADIVRDSCKTCFHGNDATNNTGKVQCRRNPPTVVIMQQQTLIPGQNQTVAMNVWPVMDGDDWCGEWHHIHKCMTVENCKSCSGCEPDIDDSNTPHRVKE